MLALFQTLPWRGNVRQLLNVLWNIVVLHSGPVVTMNMLPAELRQSVPEPAPASPAQPHLPAAEALDAFAGMTMDQIEQLLVERVIERNGGSLPRAARELALSPSTLYRKRERWLASPPFASGS